MLRSITRRKLLLRVPFCVFEPVYEGCTWKIKASECPKRCVDANDSNIGIYWYRLSYFAVGHESHSTFANQYSANGSRLCNDFYNVQQRPTMTVFTLNTQVHFIFKMLYRRHIKRIISQSFRVAIKWEHTDTEVDAPLTLTPQTLCLPDAGENINILIKLTWASCSVERH